MGKLNKKAQIASGITWIPAVLIIVFILVLFLSFSYFFTSKKNSINLNQDAILENNFESFLARNILFQKINGQIEYEGEKFEFLNFFLMTLDSYLNDQTFVNNFNLSNLDEMQIKKSEFIEFRKRNNLDADFIREEQKKFGIIKNYLDDKCYVYLLKTPLSNFYNINGGGFGKEPVSQIEGYNFNSFFELEVPYRGKSIKLNFRTKKIC
ncbi:MAG: hypothetical protein AABX30_03525 [Nanoarchaeota archaeon]